MQGFVFLGSLLGTLVALGGVSTSQQNEAAVLIQDLLPYSFSPGALVTQPALSCQGCAGKGYQCFNSGVESQSTSGVTAALSLTATA